jgi:hypothetical protein
MILGFVHVPKTGGSTILSKGKTKTNLCSGKGHIPHSKFKEHTHKHDYFITMIRDPYQQSISFYYDMKRSPEYNIDFSLEDFLSNPNHRNKWGINYEKYYEESLLKDFSFVGITNHMNVNRMLLKKMFDFNFSEIPINTNPKKNFSVKYDSVFKKKEFMKIYSNEYDLYFEGIDRFNQLCRKHLGMIIPGVTNNGRGIS